MIVVENIHKHFGGFRAVDGASLTIEDGSITGLIGPLVPKDDIIHVIRCLPLTSGKVTMYGRTSPASLRMRYLRRDYLERSRSRMSSFNDSAGKSDDGAGPTGWRVSEYLVCASARAERNFVTGRMMFSNS